MIFIFGFGEPKTTEIGLSDELKCGSCEKKAFHHLAKVTEWVSIFFIKIIPQKSTYYLVCPHCGKGNRISKEDFDKKRPVAELHKKVQQGEIDRDAYEKALKDLHHDN